MKKIFPLVVLPLLLLVVFLPKFLIKVQIVCRGQNGNCPQSVLEKAETLSGKSYFTVKKDIRKILDSDILISNYSIQFKLPDVLKVNLSAKEAIFSLKSNLSQKFAMIAEDGVVLDYSDQSSLPSVLIDSELPLLGTKIDGRHKLALELIDGVFKMYQVGYGNLSGDTLLVDLPGEVRVIFPLIDSDRSILLGSLRLVYSNMQKDDGKKYSQIDLRYENPVLR